MTDFIKSPLNYIGGKYKILPQIFPLFPREINCFVDLFAGGANVGINANSKKIILNDNLIYLIDMFQDLATTPEEKVLDYIDKTVVKFELSMNNADGYIKLREQYNKAKKPLDLLILTFFHLIIKLDLTVITNSTLRLERIAVDTMLVLKKI